MTSERGAYAPPVEDRAAPEDDEALARDHRRIVRLHLAAWAVLALVTSVSAIVLGTELWTPEPTLRVEAFSRALHVHQVTGFAVLLAPVAGIAGLVVVPARLERAGLRWQWLAYVGLVGWIAGVLVLLFAPDDHAFGIPGSVLGIAALVTGLACLAFMLALELVAERSSWHRAPLLVFGVGVATVLQLLAFARSCVQFLGTRFDLPTFGSGLDYLMPLAYPVALGIAGDLLERSSGRTLPRRWAMSVIAVLALTPWLPHHPLVDTPAAIAGLLVLVGAPLWWVRGANRADPRTLASLLAILFVALASLLSSVGRAIYVDVHLDDTYFVTATVHARAAVGLSTILALFFDRPALVLGRTPRPRLGAVGLLLLGLGCTGLVGYHTMLGWSGMPRHYYTYVPQFTDLHVASIVAGAVAGVGLLLVTVALVGSRHDIETRQCRRAS